MKAAQLVGMLVAGALSTVAVGQAQAEGGFSGLEKIKEKWEKRFSERDALREKITSDLKKQDAELEKVQHDLKSATGEKKIDALTSAVNALIEQHLETNKKMIDHLDKFSSKKDMPESDSDADKSVNPDALPAK